MKYPKLLKLGDTIGICAPSCGVPNNHHNRLENAIANIESLGYKTIESESVRNANKCVSADSVTRTAEFMDLYNNPKVTAIIPPWGGEFLMDMLPYLDLADLNPKWVCGYSDISTLIFVMTIKYDIATIHGSNLLNMGYKSIHESDIRAFDAMANPRIIQHNAPFWGSYSGWDINTEIYSLTNENKWKSLNGDSHQFSGRMIGGCMDTLCNLIGTRFAPVDQFIDKYKNDGFIWTLESCEMTAAEIYRTLWQMRECGWFKYCTGLIYGRPDGYADVRNFTLLDAFLDGIGSLNIPVIYNADIGHIPPQMQIINGAIGNVVYDNGNVTVTQKMI